MAGDQSEPHSEVYLKKQTQRDASFSLLIIIYILFFLTGIARGLYIFQISLEEQSFGLLILYTVYLFSISLISTSCFFFNFL